MDNNKLTLLVLFDLTKAFDYVDHKDTLINLVKLGFSFNTIKWFYSYLTNRSQSVIDNMGSPAEFLNTTSDVPQGSVLGPILFLIIMNSVASRLAHCKHGLFADDKFIYLHFYAHQLHDAVPNVTSDAQAVADWVKDHGLEINLNKTTVMILGINSKLKMIHRESLPPIIVNGIPLPYTDSTKCLGLHVSSNLSWNLHVSKTVSTINSALYSLKLRKNIYSTDIKRLLVSATILPLIDYCSIVLSDATYDNNRKLQTAMNSAIRFIYNLKRDEYISPYRHNLGWLSIKSRRIYYLSCFF